MMPMREGKTGFGGWLAGISDPWIIDSKLDKRKYRGWVMKIKKNMVGSMVGRS